MADERNPEIVNTPKQYTARQEFDEANVDTLSGVNSLDVGSIDYDGSLPENVIITVGEDGNLFTTHSITSSTTPIQDALDAVNNSSGGGGKVILPPEGIAEDGPINLRRGVDLIGGGGKGRGSSSIFIQDEGVDGMVIGTGVTDLTVQNLWLIGPGDDVKANGTSPVSAIHFNGNQAHSLKFNQIRVSGWYGSAIKNDGGSGAFENEWHGVVITNVDAGDSEAVIDWESGGAINNWGMVAIYPSDSSSGTDSKIARLRATHMIKNMNIGGTAGQALETEGKVDVSYINWEPVGNTTTPSYLVIAGSGGSYTRVGHLQMYGTDAVAERAYKPDGGYFDFGAVTYTAGGTLNTREFTVTLQDYPDFGVFRGDPTSAADFGPNSGQNIWLSQAGRWFDPAASGTVTATSGGSTTINGITATETQKPSLVEFSPDAGGVGSDYAAVPYFQWNNANGEWDMVIEWQTDPGSNVDFYYEAIV